MEGIHSYEQRSSTDGSVESHTKPVSRLVVVDRHKTDAIWSSPESNNRATINNRIRWSCCCRESGPSRISTNLSRLNKGLNMDSKLSNLLQPLDIGPFQNNEWVTSKYTLLTFLPKNLFEQFRRLANFYFLTTAILQIILPFSPVGPATSLLPLTFVISTTAIKQAYEDYLRHKLDKEVNNRHCQILRGKKLIRIRTKDIQVGDIVYVRNNEEIPCDMIVLSTSGTGDRCYVTTANLDGETSLKGRTCSTMKSLIGPIELIDNSLLVVDCEPPNATLYEFNGVIRVPKNIRAYERLVADISNEQMNVQHSNEKRRTAIEAIYNRLNRTSSIITTSTRRTNEHRDSEQASNLDNSLINRTEYHEIPLDISNLLLRASRLRNTNYVYGLAIYTGNDTRMAHNSQVKPNKFASSERKVNTFLLISFCLVMSLSFISAYMYGKLNRNQTEKQESFVEIFISHFLIYNYLVPISLYVSLEFVKFLGTKSVVDDAKLKCTVWQSISQRTKSKEDSTSLVNQPKKDQQNRSNKSERSTRLKIVEGPRCNSSDLNGELGQVDVLFSDKTGTLTENKMRFKACSIYSELYRSIGNQIYHQPVGLCYMPIQEVARKLASVNSNRYALMATKSASQFSAKTTLSRECAPLHERPFDHRYLPPLSELKLVDNLELHERVVEFFICLCLCSTISLNETAPLIDCLPDKQKEYDFQTASPDEESLIGAATKYGVTMCKSNEKECYIVILRSQPLANSETTKAGQQKDKKFKAIVENTEFSTSKYIVRHFERLLTLEFNSIRKRMSVIYRDCDNDCIIMVTKGSESLIDCIRLTNLNPQEEQNVDSTLAHFEAFAKSGLRTLLVARRLFTEGQYEQISNDMKDARLSIQNRDYMLNSLYKRVENGLDLIGTTAVEDTLQDGVPQTIANLKEAGIKVWLLTGDKVETAISVAYLCKLLDRDMMSYYLVRQPDHRSCSMQLKAIKQQILNISKSTEAVEIELETLSARFSGHESSTSSHKRSRSQSSSVRAKFRYALIVDGRSLYYAMKYDKKDLAFVGKQCDCVLGCRLSPLQKAEVVDMIKKGEESPITAAIGDGANDVSMIQEAHVGIGVSGKEGRQAVNSSDFAINRFHMLNRLLFVHGHLFYHRTANTIHYFFYKNMIFVLPQFLYSFYTLSSATSLYHPMMLISYNLIFTSLPILLYGLTEVHIPESMLEEYPRLYRINKHNSQMRLSVFIFWLMFGGCQALIAFYLIYYIWNDHSQTEDTPKMAGLAGFSLLLYFVVVFTATIRLYFMSRSHGWALSLSSIFSCILLSILLFVGEFFIYFKSPMFWLAVLITVSATTILDLVCYVIKNTAELRPVSISPTKRS